MNYYNLQLRHFQIAHMRSHFSNTNFVSHFIFELMGTKLMLVCGG
jgi:hypothetical protein